MITRILIARHGNTFGPNETPRRIGSATDLSLTETVRGKALGEWILKNEMIPSKIYASPLKRTKETAQLVVEQLDTNIQVELDHRFTEIDYGPDENKTEEEVWERLGRITKLTNSNNTKTIQENGKETVQRWNTKAEVPDGWIVNPEILKTTWLSLAKEIENTNLGKNILVVTSNGVARFAPILTGNFETFAHQNYLKIKTGALCVFEKSKNDTYWKCVTWNLIPTESIKNNIGARRQIL